MDVWIPTCNIFGCCGNISSSYAHTHGIQVLATDIHEMNREYPE